MINYCGLFACIFITFALSTCVSAYHDLDMIRFTPENMIYLKGTVDEESVGNVVKKLHLLDTDHIYIYLDTPGGSVVDGYNIVDAIQTIAHNKTIECIAETAISMGFVIFQHCPVRYIRPGAVLMQHQMSIGLKGTLESVKSKLDFAIEMNDILSKKQAERLEMTVDDFNRKTQDDWWMFGEKAIHNKAADKMVRVQCSRELYNDTMNMHFQTIFGPIEVIFSKCPLIKLPLSINIDEKYVKGVDLKEVEKEVAKIVWNKFHLSGEIDIEFLESIRY